MRSRKRETATPSSADAIVLDTGAANVHICAAGRAPADVRVFPNAIARTRPGVRRQVLVADQIESECLDYGGLQLRAPIDRGLFVDWPAQKAVWDRALRMVAGAPAGDSFHALEGRVVIATEPYFLLPDQQRAMDALLFDWYGAEAIWRATPAQLVPFAPSLGPSRPECLLVVDCGHSYAHAVPLVRDRAQWQAAKRLDLGGRVLTNVLKEMFSFRQWNMMEETFLTDKMKAHCFVAAPEYEAPRHASGEQQPHEWSFNALVELFHEDPDNALVQRYVLPDYARPEEARDPHIKYGYVVAGPGSRENPNDAPAGASETERLDLFIAGQRYAERAGDPSRLETSTSAKRAVRAAGEEEHQMLALGQERFQVFEHLFAPERLGLDQGSLPELVEQSIRAAPPECQGLLWTNVVLVGGVANVPGLRRRLEHELRAVAPDEVPVSVRTPTNPTTAAAEGAAALVQSPPTSPLGRFLQAHLLTRDTWQKHGGSAADRNAAYCADAVFGGWNAASSAHS